MMELGENESDYKTSTVPELREGEGESYILIKPIPKERIVKGAGICPFPD